MEEVLKGTNVLVEFKEIRTILNIESYKSHFKWIYYNRPYYGRL